MRLRLLFLADSSMLHKQLESVLKPIDVVLSAAPRQGNFWDHVGDASVDVIVVSYALLPEPATTSVKSLHNLPQKPDVIVVWRKGDEAERAKLLVAGCVAVIDAELSDDLLRDTIRSLVERRRETSIARLQREITEPQYRLSDFESSSPVMVNFLRIVRRVVEPDSSLLILGETGVGKERLARAIHAESPRGSQPFIAVICAAFPETLLEGELFGYEAGAFTGATGDRRGYFELAHGGTIFLDEIGELPRHLQVKLLRVLQERTIQPLGGEKSIAINVRVMAATNRDLEEEIKARRFRRDLYYRLGVVTLEVPPLREHPEDIPDLLHRYLEEFRVRLGRNVTAISNTAMEMLCHYEWPGNIRELVNVVERAMILCEGETLTPAELSPAISGLAPRAAADWARPFVPGIDLEKWFDRPWEQVRHGMLAECERAYLEHQLRACHGRLAQVAERTNIPPRTLYAMMQKHRLKKEGFRTRRATPHE